MHALHNCARGRLLKVTTKVLNADHRRYKQNSRIENEMRRRPFQEHWVSDCLRNGENGETYFCSGNTGGNLNELSRSLRRQVELIFVR